MLLKHKKISKTVFKHKISQTAHFIIIIRNITQNAIKYEKISKITLNIPRSVKYH